jgi:hypothetical protein
VEPRTAPAILEYADAAGERWFVAKTCGQVILYEHVQVPVLGCSGKLQQWLQEGGCNEAASKLRCR